MKKIINHILSTSYKWLAAAAIIYLLSFLFSNQLKKQGVLGQDWKKLQQYLNKSESEFETFIKDTSTLYKLAGHTENREENVNVFKKQFDFFLYNKDSAGTRDLLFWNNQESTPDENLFSIPDSCYFRKLSNGYYLCIKKTLVQQNNKDSLVAIGLIPVLFDYFVETGSLPNRFAFSETASLNAEITKDSTDYPLANNEGRILFYIGAKIFAKNADINITVTWLRLLTVVLLLLFVYFLSGETTKRKGVFYGVLILVLLLVVLRLLGYFTSFPINLRQFELFDPSVYAANAVQKSLGDLLINATFFCWITVYTWNNVKEKNQDWVKQFSPNTTMFIGVLSLVIIVAFTFIMSKIIRSLAADSNISFDVINFFSLNRHSVFGFAALSVLAIGYYFFIRILLQLIRVLFNDNYLLIYFIVAITGLSYLTLKIHNPLLSFYMAVLAWLVLYIRLQRLEKFSINNAKVTIANTLFWIFLFSVSISTIIIIANREKEWELRKKLADKIDIQSDPYNERQLSISFAYIDDDFLRTNFSRFTNEDSSLQFRNSIMRDGGYLKNFESRIYVFDAQGNPLNNDDNQTYNTLNTIVKVQAKQTHRPNLFFYENSYDKFTFFFKREARDTARKLLGTLFIVSSPTQYSSEALYPELFRKNARRNPEESPVYSIATYKDGILLTNPANRYAFATRLLPADKPTLQIEKRINKDSDELWYKSANDKIVVIAKKRDSVIEAITLFSYIFCAFLMLVGFFNLVSVLLKASSNYEEFKKLFQWNIRTQVHSTIIFISIVSFVIIGIATISFFIQRYEKNNTEKLNSTMQTMVNDMEKKLDKQKVFDDQLPFYDSIVSKDVQGLINEVAEIHNVDVNLYDTSGNLQVTSAPIIYREGYLSKKIHPLAYFNLNRLRQVQYVQEEKLATLNYLSIYAPIRDVNGHAYAYLNIPYFLSQSELKQEISYFLVTIINLNAFIFLIAGVIALFITNRVTRSFSIISEKMKKVNLGKTNEEIDWKRDDEIGELVVEYNKMVNKLEDSATALARSEREGAWREMARQVAHEIKNPLTPMKLSIQYLQKSIDNNTGNIKELTSSVAKTLVEQIDHLSKIAFDFSQFANIGNTYPEEFDVREVLYSLRDLYQMNENAELVIYELPEEIILYNDKTQMNRLFTNLFQNALEAYAGEGKCKIEVSAVKKDGVVIICVKDNGEGIPEEMQSRIFAPNFTTKSSGTGLGLAMCKGIVEQAKGRIWFETKKGEGTVFFVELPVSG